MQKNNFKKNLLIVLISSIISAILYRLGGIGGKYFKSWMRDWVIPVLAYGGMLFFWHPTIWYGWLMFLLAILLTGGALTTYWDKLFGNIDNFYMHGGMVGLGAIPFAFVGLHWWAILIRAIILCISMGLINKYVNKWNIPCSDWIEELSRGFLILITIPILLL